VLSESVQYRVGKFRNPASSHARLKFRVVPIEPPGAGPKLAPRLLGEIGDDRERFDGDAQNLQCLAGTAPVTKRSGKDRECHQRWACNKYLRYAVHLFSEHTITRCAWAEIYYKAHRTKDHSHARALRCLGKRWLKIIHKMWMIEHRTTQSYTT
jgi:hypothetical protein